MSPYPGNVEAGKSCAWSSCFLSKNRPFCDGSRKGSGFSPTMFEADKTETVCFCGCKHSQTGARDGSHESPWTVAACGMIGSAEGARPDPGSFPGASRPRLRVRPRRSQRLSRPFPLLRFIKVSLPDLRQFSSFAAPFRSFAT